MAKYLRTPAELERELARLRKIDIQKLSHLKEEQKKKQQEFEHEVRKTAATAIASAFSFIIALFWRDAIQDLITKLLETLGLSSSGHLAKLIAAILVTFIGVFAIMRISKWGEVNKDKLSQ